MLPTHHFMISTIISVSPSALAHIETTYYQRMVINEAAEMGRNVDMDVISMSDGNVIFGMSVGKVKS